MSASVCRQCGRPADPFRDHVQVVGMRVELTCRSCASGATVAAPVPATAPAPAPAPPPAAPARAPGGTAKPVAGRKEAIALVGVLVVAAASISVALAIRARRSASASSAPSPVVATAGSDTGVAEAP